METRHYGYSTPNAVEVANNADYVLLDNGDVAVKRAAILWSNFSGAPTNVNPQGGKRTFNLVLRNDIATTLADRGWNIRVREPNREGDEPTIYTEIVIKMDSVHPPMIHTCSEFAGRKSRNLVTEETIDGLDRKRYSKIDLVVHPYEHGREVSSGTTIKGYLRSMNLVLENDDYFADDYADYENDEEEAPFD